MVLTKGIHHCGAFIPSEGWDPGVIISELYELTTTSSAIHEPTVVKQIINKLKTDYDFAFSGLPRISFFKLVNSLTKTNWVMTVLLFVQRLICSAMMVSFLSSIINFTRNYLLGEKNVR